MKRDPVNGINELALLFPCRDMAFVLINLRAFRSRRRVKLAGDETNLLAIKSTWKEMVGAKKGKIVRKYEEHLVPLYMHVCVCARVCVLIKEGCFNFK